MPTKTEKIVEEKDGLRALDDEAQRQLAATLAYAADAQQASHEKHRWSLNQMSAYCPSEVFALIDTSGDKKIGPAELERFLVNNGIEFGSGLIQFMFKNVFDLDRDGSIDFEEFAITMLAPCTLSDEQLKAVLGRKAPRRDDAEKPQVSAAVQEAVCQIIAHQISTRERFLKLRGELKSNATFSNEACYRLLRMAGDGFEGVSKADLEAFLKAHGRWVYGSRLEYLFKDIDSSDNQLISREELFALLDGEDFGRSSASYSQSSLSDPYSFERYLDQKYPLSASRVHYTPSYYGAPSHYYGPRSYYF